MPITERSGDAHKTLSDALTPEGSADLHYFCLMITGVLGTRSGNVNVSRGQSATDLALW